jgi:hypothetical protein
MNKIVKIFVVIFIATSASFLSARNLTITNLADLGKKGQIRITQQMYGAEKKLGEISGIIRDDMYPESKTFNIPNEQLRLKFEYTDLNNSRSQLKYFYFDVPVNQQDIVLKVDKPNKVWQ